MKSTLILTCCVLAFGWATTAQAVTMDWAHIGNAGNAGELSPSGAGGLGANAVVGAVAYNYAIGKTEVSNDQYVEFLNAVAASDPYGLYNTNMASSTEAGITRSGSPGSYTYAVKADAVGQGPGGVDYTHANKPVVYVSWYDAIRFTNWLHNGQGAGGTETGAYTLLGGTATPSNGPSITRNSGAKFWLPSEDEWYKAAFHDASAGTTGAYFDYATGTDTGPDNNLPSADSGNSANHRNGTYTHSLAYPLTDVGSYSLSESPYGTYDQGGNVWEWNEVLVTSTLRGLGGGSWALLTNNLAASVRGLNNPIHEIGSAGFRVATVPEPTSMLLLVSLAGGMLLKRRA